MLVCTDLDGTLLPNAGTTLGQYTQSVLKRVDEAGIPVVFVTGRPIRRTAPLWPHVGGHGVAIVSNGAITYDVHNGRVLHIHGITPSVRLQAVGSIAAAVPGALFAIECLDGIRRTPAFLDALRAPEHVPTGPIEEIWNVPAVKLLVRHDTLDHDHFYEAVHNAVGDALTLTWSIPGLIEISAAGVTKASALVQLCDEMNILAADVVAFGDMPNDLPMLEWAGQSYAMADGHQSVLSIADRAAPSCASEGVARVLDALLFSQHA